MTLFAPPAVSELHVRPVPKTLPSSPRASRGLPLLPAVALVVFLFPADVIWAGDWPMWRYDAARSAASPDPLPEQLHLSWVRQFTPRQQVWDDPLNHDLMQYDKHFEPIVLGNRLFLGFNDTDRIVALDTKTGAESWTFYTDGPVRLPPAGWEGKVYFTSDDGCLYCVEAETGRLVWKFRGGPSERKAIGNHRLISAWPARGGAVLRDGTIYFAASIWPFMGTFIYALDARDGSVVWVNDQTGADYIRQPHSAPSFAGVAPQGAFVATEEILLVPGGRSVPAGFDRKTGLLLHFLLNDGGKGNGGAFVAAGPSEYYVHTRLKGVRNYDLNTGRKRTQTSSRPVIVGDTLYTAEPRSGPARRMADKEIELQENRQIAYARSFEIVDAEIEDNGDKVKKLRTDQEKTDNLILDLEEEIEELRAQAARTNTTAVVQALGPVQRVERSESDDGDRRERRGRRPETRPVLWELPVDGTADLIMAGSRLYAASSNQLHAIDLPADEGAPKVSWSHPVDGQVERLIAAAKMLFAVTEDGRILAFGSEKMAAPPTFKESHPTVPRPSRNAAVLVRTLAQQAKSTAGYALCYGAEDIDLLRALVHNTEFQIVVVDPDEARVEKLRRELSGVYGRRLTAHVGDPLSFQAPPYFAQLVLVDSSFAPERADRVALRRIYDSVRPYGGVLWLPRDGAGPAQLAGLIDSTDLPKAETTSLRQGLAVHRQGALPGAADWTHQYGDIANTVKSDDQLVKAPLGVLWFGGSSNMDVLPRHGHGPPQQVVGGRLIIQGMNSLSARDVYTGRVLWKREFEDLGTDGIYYNESYTNTPLSVAYNQKHIPGANGRGANYVATAAAIYLAIKDSCLVLDPASGKTVSVVYMPPDPITGHRPHWGFLGVYQDLLLGGAGFAHFRRQMLDPTGNVRPSIEDFSASRGLAAFDRHTGQLVWQVKARHAFLHNGIVAGGGHVYCLDRLPRSAEGRRKRRGLAEPDNYRVAAFSARTGQLAWEQSEDIFGTWLSYSDDHDILLQAGASASDRLSDEVGKGMIAYNARDGSVRWQDLERPYTGPCILHNDVIITTANSYKASSGSFRLDDGTPHLVSNPLTGRMEPWRITRAYGCNTVIASEHLLTFRSGAAGFYDMESHSGTANVGGFKSSCTSNLVIANGVLNAPDYTRTCSCAYQNQTSLALIHVPDMEMWSHSRIGHDAKEGDPVLRVGLNFGAPGDRRAPDGTLWLDYPTVGGDSPGLPVTLEGDDHDFFRRHATQVTGALSWVAASGVVGLRSLSVTPTLIPPKNLEPRKADEDEDMIPGSDATAEAPLLEQPESTQPTRYTLRLCFAEPEDLQPGDRVFSISIQGQVQLAELDIVKETGTPRVALIREIKGVEIPESLQIDFTPALDSTHPPLICGLELVAEPSRLAARAD